MVRHPGSIEQRPRGNRVEGKVAIVTGAGSGIVLGAAANLVAYSVAKGALLTLTRSIASAYARDGIRANYLIPGWVLTDTERVVQAREGHDAAWLEATGANLPGGRHSYP